MRVCLITVGLGGRPMNGIGVESEDESIQSKQTFRIVCDG